MLKNEDFIKKSLILQMSNTQCSQGWQADIWIFLQLLNNALGPINSESSLSEVSKDGLVYLSTVKTSGDMNL